MHLIKTANQIHASDIEDIFNHKLVALKIPNYFPMTSVQKASEWILTNHSYHQWYLDSSQKVITDMSYILGIPRQVACRSKEAAQLYHEVSQTFLSDLDQAFGNNPSPLRKLLETLQNLFPQFFIEDFENKPGLPAILRFMSPQTSIGEDVWKEGVCHIDSPSDKKLLSINLYLTTPQEGGELKLWNIPHKEKNTKNSLYRLILHHAFDRNFRDKIQPFLPEPMLIKVAPGDLVIFDTSVPHAVRGFEQGERLTIQTFLKRGDKSLILLS